MLGIIEIVIGVAFLLVTLFSQERANWVYSLLAAVLILLGIYGMLFYRYIFPSRLKKAARNNTQEPLSAKWVEFRFYEDAFREISAETDSTVDWGRSSGSLHRPFDRLMLANRRCVIIPRTSIRSFDTEFLKYLERQIHHHGITASTRNRLPGNRAGGRIWSSFRSITAWMRGDQNEPQSGLAQAEGMEDGDFRPGLSAGQRGLFWIANYFVGVISLAAAVAHGAGALLWHPSPRLFISSSSIYQLVFEEPKITVDVSSLSARAPSL